MAAELHFDVVSLKETLAHVKASKQHRKMRGKRARPGLLLAKDQGIYMVSTGIDSSTTPALTYARGYSPADANVWERAAAAVGGDDFMHFIDVKDIERALAATKFPTILIQISAGSISIFA